VIEGRPDARSIELGFHRDVMPVRTENLIRVDDVMESPKLAE
jgi:hypothetical protein